MSDRQRTFFRVISLVALLVTGVTAVYAQDQKPVTPQVLPFQQSALEPTADEPLAIQFYQNREYEKAALIFEQLYEKKPSQYYFQYLVLCLAETKDYNKAEKLIKKCMRAEPDAIRYQVDLGYIYFRSGNQEKANKIYEEALKDLGPNQQQVFELANAFILKGENDFAIRTYMKGRQLSTNGYTFGFELANLYDRMGDLSKAMDEYLSLLELNRSYLVTIQDRIQMTLNFDVNNEKNNMLRSILLTKAQKNPDKTVYAELLWWYSIQQKDFDLALIQAKALDRRLGENGEKLIQLASLAIPNEKYDVAIECYRYLISRGPDGIYYDLSRRELLNTRYARLILEPVPGKKELFEIETEFIAELNRSGETPENIILIRNLAHIEAFFLDKTDDAVGRLQSAVVMAGASAADKAKCKIELADILLFTGDVWQATLLYQQAYQDFKFDVLGQEAKFRNAKLSFYIGEFQWAKSQADILKASTSKFISNDAIALSLLISENYDPDSNTVALGMYARAELLDYRNADDKALQTLDSVGMQFADHPILQHILFKKGEIFRKMGRFQASDSLFGEVIREYPDGLMADEAVMQSAALREKQLNDRDGAMARYLELLDKYPGSIYVPDARRKYRELRGDR